MTLTILCVPWTDDMAREYNRIQKRVREDPGTAGDQGEENWAILLREWLPPTYQIVTKGRILGSTGKPSPQIDVLVLHPTYPKALLNVKLYLASGVAAAFECKITLKAKHIKEAVANGVKIRRCVQERTGSPYKELHSPIIYGLLAHSHTWKRPGSRPVENVFENLLSADHEFVKHPREMLDVICVADLAAWVSRRISWIGPGMNHSWNAVSDVYPSGGSAETSYVCYSSGFKDQKASFTPIGGMISNLLRKLAWENPSVRRLAQYFVSAQMAGTGGRGSMRQWQHNIYSNEIRNDVTSCQNLSRKPWDEWSVFFR